MNGREGDDCVGDGRDRVGVMMVLVFVGCGRSRVKGRGGRG